MLALAGQDRRAPISGEVVGGVGKIFDSASMVTFTENINNVRLMDRDL